jgi:uncharacterized protein
MRLVLDSNSTLNLVREYGNGSVVVAERRITQPFVLTPTRVLLEWPVSSLLHLQQQDLQPLFETGAQIILLGAGESQTFASAAVRASCRERGIALECMTLGAACRTYNILASEERPVAAGLFP